MENHGEEKGLREEMANHGQVTPPSLLPPPPGPCPWLMSADCDHQTFYGNISGPSAAVKTYCKSIPALEDKQVLSCSYGWLVLYDDNNKVLSICNSTTFGDTVLLPRLTQVSDHGVSSCVLLPNKNTTCFDQLDNFKVIIFLKEFPAIMCGRIGACDEEWIEHRYWTRIKDYFPNWRIREDGYLIFRRAVVCGRKIFAELGAICLWNSIFWSIEITEDEEFHFSKIEEPRGDPSSPDALLKSKKTYVVESNGELFFLYFWRANLVFDVYRVKLENMEWEKIRYLEDRAFFIGKEYSVSCPVSVSGFESGRIYFTTKRKDGNLYSFYMKDQSVSVSPLSTTLWLRRPVWIMPRLLLRPEDDDHDNINNQSTICRSVAPSVNWRRVLSTSSEAPLLMFADQDESIYKFVDPSINNINNNHYQMKIPNPLLDHKIIRYSSHGWLLLSERHSDILLYNPFTGDIIIYNSKAPAFSESLFFFPKSSGIGINNDAHSFCHVVGFGLLDNVVFTSTIDDPRAEEWAANDPQAEEEWTLNDPLAEEWTLNQCRDFQVGTQISPVFFEDTFYYLDKKGKLGELRIDFEEVGFSWEVFDKPRIPSFNNCIDLSFYHNFLVECGGELISVFLGSLGKSILVYKLNADRNWERVTNLGGYDLYLSITSSLSVQSNEGGNRIYFSVIRGSEIAYFSLNTNKWHFSGGQDSASDICGTRWLGNSCWIKPAQLHL